MADFNKVFDHLLQLEGGYVDDPLDKGQATRWGVTLNTWINNGYDKNGDNKIDKEDVKLITKEDAYKIAKKLYWDAVKGDKINNQSIAEFIFDWGYNSGTKTAIKKVQQALNISVDGVIGIKTLAVINQANQEVLFNKLVESRHQFIQNIIKNNPSQAKFRRGWENRINSFKFKE